MSGLVVAALILSIVGHSSATWCVCKEGAGDAVLQKTLDYACGAGADCNTIHQNGGCYSPNTVRAHCNYAVNSYFQKKGQAQGSCDFSGTASVTTTDPSTAGCAYPASASAASTSTTPATTTTPSTATPGTTTTPATTTTPSTTTTTTTPVTGSGSPYITTPTGVLGPSGTGINTDVSHGGFTLRRTSFSYSVATLMVSGLVLLPWV
ncbi:PLASMODESMATA CALLOSE-BINDING PROTEIN 3-like [Rhododendron vialii]|uniref:PLASMODESMATA CALLOSE-BINDING PROTEIN 3-like n=1 Tax=Rhododendron vialii TaxID=182163 RepID=UPI00265E04B9|nr:PLASMODESMATA CALLOSE-BINDING PROTEIN 3-like [Rhododendron vialii]